MAKAEHGGRCLQVKALRNQIASISEESGAERLKLLDARQEAERLSGLIVEVGVS